ncbi:MAG: ABC transporter permease subunit [Chloroflexi bacterium]|nr:ABC transporter permease subunit [Chloroflexota bacterium]
MATAQRVQALPRRRVRWPIARHDLRLALIITRREVRDAFRDWRIIVPIFILTLVFPLLMNFTAGRLLSFVSDYGAEIVGTRLVPFLLLVVGFFPTSFSLVIALETFVGEKERNSLEPLLATPLTNQQLYLGKMLAAVVPPLTASYLGIAVYLAGLAVTVGWYPSWQLLVQTVLLTTIQGIMMVSGAVIVSSQTTSTRAANLLASFIIVPMALLLQFEAVVMFWGNYAGLWWLLLALLITAVILVRMGIYVFNREELLGRDIDQIRLGWMARLFWNRLTGRSPEGRYPSLRNWYRQTLALLPGHRMPLTAAFIAFLGALFVGYFLAQHYPFPPALQARLSEIDQVQNISRIAGVAGRLPLLIFTHNLRVIVLASLLGVFTFGVAGLGVYMLPWTLIAYMAAQLAAAGESPWQFLLATIAPHATVELPALLLVAAAALRWQSSLIAPTHGRTISESWLTAAADFSRLFVGVAAPLLLLAALIEALVTPQVVVAVFGGG